MIARWNMQDAGSSPAGAPFHPGAIKYLREKGIWDAEDDAWNETRMARLEAVKAAWAAATEKADAEKVSDDDWPAFWDSYRSDALN